MGKTRWTEEQEKAIYTSGTNLLISAGAGSGKTAVLTERILEKLKQGLSLKNLIVLTFTNAAAFEMKERVRKKIKEELEKGTSSLQEQLSLLDDASICTFDSFSLNLVKKYHYLLGLEPDIHICDNVILLNKKKEILDSVFLSFYEEKNPSFLTFIDTFSMKDDTKLQRYVDQISSKLNSLYDKDTYLKNYTKAFYTEENIDKNVEKYIAILADKRDLLFEELEKMECKISDPILREWYENVYQNLSVLEKGNTYATFRESNLLKFPSMTRSKKVEEEDLLEIKENYQRVKEYLDFIKKRTLYLSKEEIVEEIKTTKETSEVLIEILTRYEEKVLTFKKEYNMFEFADIGRFAIQILEKFPDIRENYKENTFEIMIDEYQDTNDIGDYFVSLIANNNVYMVGDVKQSIYGFRNANPLLFMKKYGNYQKNIDGQKIDLVKNFRSRKEVLEGINAVFGQLMDIKVGGAAYNEGHQMLFGNNMYEENKCNQNQKLEVLDYSYEKGEYTKEETEAFIVGNDILEKIKNRYQVIDEKKGGMRPCTYKDFTILMDRKTNFELYKKIFTYLEIPMTIHKEEGFGDTHEIYVLRSILKLINAIGMHNTYTNDFAHSLMSVMRSFVCEYTDAEIFSLFASAKKEEISIYKALQKEPYIPLYQKLKSLVEKSSILPLHSLLKEVYDTFSIYTAIEKIGEVALVTNKLSYLLEVATTLENMSSTIEDLIVYFDEALQNKIEASFSSGGGSENTVHMMTIHKSKGLEFPICYYSGLYKKFSVEEFKDKFLYSDSYGILVPIFKEGIKETIYKELLKNEYHEKDVSEKIRLFYVALTRAKEKMILVAPLQDSKVEEGTAFYQKMNYHSFYDMLCSIKTSLLSYCTKVDISSLPFTHAYLETKSVKEIEKENRETLPLREIHLEKKEVEKKHFSKAAGLITKKEKQNMEYGVLLHAYLEILDFKNIENDFLKYDVPSFYQNKINAFLKVPFLENYKTLYKEYSFLDPDTEQLGMIDLLIEKEEKYIIVDYKTKEIAKEVYDRQVKGYMKYIQTLTGKPVEGYLYSLLDEIYKEV
ncbi:MAG: UvrD-helicase domain-containing protein [Bacilli bacterium]|nr:UvrD-helicase domain-containing protein [Bacilli bacterium]